MLFQCNRLGASLVAVSLLTLVYPTGAAAETRMIRRGDNLQSALNAANAGDVLVLEAGAEFVGNFTLPVKSGSQPIIVRSSPSSALPADGVRITPAHAALLAKIRSPNSVSALRTAAGAKHWHLQYLEFRANRLGYYDIMQIGDGSGNQNTLAEVPSEIVLSHLYVHGDVLVGQKRCIALNAAQVTIRDSYIAECKGVGFDSQAIGGWNGPGPYLIENNYLEAAGENVMFGGADPSLTNVVAQNVVIRRNHLSRPMSWREPIIPTPQLVVAEAAGGGTLAAGRYAYRVVARRGVGQQTMGRSTASTEAVATVPAGEGAVRITWLPVPDASEYLVYGRVAGGQAMSWTVKTTSFTDTGAAGKAGAVPTSTGTVWSVKNLLELKHARNVLITGNVLENHWRESQPGFAVVFTPRNSGDCNWCVVEQVRFQHNIVRHVAAGINVLGYDSEPTPTLQTRDIMIENNLFYDMGAPYGGNGWFLQVGGGPRNIVINHNTISHTGTSIVYAYGGSSSAPKAVHGLHFTNNAVRHSRYGINGEYLAYGMEILQGYFPGATVTGNLLSGGSASRYPAGNRFAGDFVSEFVDAASGDFRLKATSALRGAATDGGDIGANIGALLALTANVETGRITPATTRLTAPANVRLVERE